MQQSKKIPNFNEDGLDEKKLKGNLEAATKALVLSLGPWHDMSHVNFHMN